MVAVMIDDAMLIAEKLQYIGDGLDSLATLGWWCFGLTIAGAVLTALNEEEG